MTSPQPSWIYCKKQLVQGMRMCLQAQCGPILATCNNYSALKTYQCHDSFWEILQSITKMTQYDTIQLHSKILHISHVIIVQAHEANILNSAFLPVPPLDSARIPLT